MANRRDKQAQTFFKTQPDESVAYTRPGSLADIVSRQLEQQNSPGAGDAYEDTLSPQAQNAYPGLGTGNTQAFLLFKQAYSRTDHISKQGNQLDKVDGQTGNGLEHLLPNAGTRYGVAHQRLEQEISELKAKIRDYENVFKASPDGQKAQLKQSIHMLKSRLMVLERRFYKVGQNLAQVELQTHPIRSSFKRPWLRFELWVSELSHQALSGLGSPKAWMQRLKSAKKIEKEQAYQALKQAQALLEAETAKASPNPETVSTLVFQYERTLQAYEKILAAKRPARERR